MSTLKEYELITAKAVKFGTLGGEKLENLTLLRNRERTFLNMIQILLL